jgi:hypothetical protein
MINRLQADRLADEAIAQFMRDAGAVGPDHTRKLLETFISKGALTIAKYCGPADAQMVLTRTMLAIIKLGGGH